MIWPRRKIRLRRAGFVAAFLLLAFGVRRSSGEQDGMFVNVTDEAEVSYVQWLPPRDYVKQTPQVMTGGAAVADFDNDGWSDLFVTRYRDTDILLRNLGDRTFEDTTDIAGVRDGGWGWGAVFFDYDNDGDLDLAMTNGFETDRWDTETPFHTDPTKMWRNDGGTFTNVSSSVGITDTDTGKGLLVFDYDKDGDLDLFIVNNRSTPILYRNDVAPGNHSLRVKARGRCSNRDGIGAVVTISPGGGAAEQTREINGGSHYLAQSENIAHFGLGGSGLNVARVTVRWPSGIEQSFSDVPDDQVFEVTEPAGTYQAWLAENFSQAEISHGEITVPAADPDEDGLDNSVEFGCGLDPRESQNTPPINVFREGDPAEMVVRFRRRSLPRGVDTMIEVSVDQARWAELSSERLEILAVEAGDGWGVEIVTARLRGDQAGQTGAAYLRLRVTLG